MNQRVIAALTSRFEHQVDRLLAEIEADPDTNRTRDLAAVLTAVATIEAGRTVASPRLMTVPQAADYLGYTESQLRTMIARKQIPVTRVNSAVRLDRVAIDRWIAEATEKAVAS